MQIFDAASLSDRADWSGPTMTGIGNAVAKLRFIKTPFRWHKNTGAELFLVLDGDVDMHVRAGADCEPIITALTPGQMVLIEDGEEHIACPRGEARVLVVEQLHSD